MESPFLEIVYPFLPYAGNKQHMYSARDNAHLADQCQEKYAE